MLCEFVYFVETEEKEVEDGGEREQTEGEPQEEEKEKETVEPEQQRLRNIITSALTTHLKQLKVLRSCHHYITLNDDMIAGISGAADE